MDIHTWLKGCDLEEYADTFAKNGVDADLLPELSNEDLKDLGITRLADRKRLLKEIGLLVEAQVPCDDAITPHDTAQAERRQVTVLFVDLANFTNLSTTIDSEDMHALLTRFYETVDETIESYGGTVDKHLGDGIMALFGAPKAFEDDPLRAVRAAFDIHAAMVKLSTQEEHELSVHVGIACGEVIAGGLGRDGQKEYTVIGESVNLASRLDGLANPGETFIDETVHGAVCDHFLCDALGDMPVKGLDTPVTVWRARTLHTIAKDTQRSPFVGRRRELRQFEGVLSSCAEDHFGQTVVLRGEAGIGKTRLVEEFMKTGETHGFIAHRGLILDFGVGTGEDAIGAIVRSLLKTPSGTDTERTAAADTALTNGWIEKEQLVFLLDFLNLPQPVELHALYNAMDYATRDLGKRCVLNSLIKAVSLDQNIILIIEDVHWADPLTLGYLAEITATVANCSAILIMTTRIEGDPLDRAWRSTTSGGALMTMDLGPLRQDEALELAGDLMEETLRNTQRCIERAEGNPLFLEQLLRNAEEIGDEAIPASIQSLVLARMDRLQDIDKNALQVAAVIGQRFSLQTLRHLIDDPHYDCTSMIEQRLVRPEGEDYLFDHALIQEGVYSSLLKARRRTLHMQAAQWFAGTDILLKAQHLERGEDAGAPTAYLHAAQQQADIFHYEHALRLIDRGLKLAKQQADQFALTCMHGKLSHDLGSIERSIQDYEQAHALAIDDEGRCRAKLGMAAGLRITDQYEEALCVLEEAERMAQSQGMVHEKAEIHHLRGNLYFPMGRFQDCATEHETALKYAQDFADPEIEAQALGGLADANYVAGRMATAFQYFSRCIDVAHTNGLGKIETPNAPMIGFSRIFLNQLHEALENATGTITAAQKIGDKRAHMLGEILSVFVLFEMAELTKARQHNDQSLELIHQLGAPRFKAQALLYEGKLLRAEGRQERAAETLKTAFDLSEQVGHGFSGARIAAELARNLTKADDINSMLAKGEQMLDAGSVSHNHFFFYPAAIDVALDMNDWDAAQHYVSALETFSKPEPLPWCDFSLPGAMSCWHVDAARTKRH